MTPLEQFVNSALRYPTLNREAYFKFINKRLNKINTMKKWIIGALVLISTFGFTSCKKDYNCVCRYNGLQVLSQKYSDMTLSEAVDKCEANDDNAGQSWDCDIE